jgi:hypothetical protein
MWRRCDVPAAGVGGIRAGTVQAVRKLSSTDSTELKRRPPWSLSSGGKMRVGTGVGVAVGTAVGAAATTAGGMAGAAGAALLRMGPAVLDGLGLGGGGGGGGGDELVWANSSVNIQAPV